jgi:SAM-dependent methyltransferase
MAQRIDVYDEYATEYAEMVAKREAAGIGNEPVIPRMLAILGDVGGLRVLDAGCGEGYLSRILAARGAQVTGTDISPRLIGLARARDPQGTIEYRMHDLGQPLPEYEGQFDRIASHFVLNDVYDYRGFIATLYTLARPGGRLVLSMNNPYSYVVRNHIRDYFASGVAFPYRGMSREGVKVHFYQRTLEEYLDAFLTVGWQLQRLVDVPTPESWLHNLSDKLIPDGYQFPFVLILSFVKPKESERYEQTTL